MPDLVPGSALLEHFHWREGQAESLESLAKSGIAIQLNARFSKAALAGSVLACGVGYVLALRFVPSSFEIGSDNLQISDFAPDDPAVAGIMLIGLQRAMIEESRTVALDLARERQRSISLLERISRVSGFMAHDFNNFLSIIKLNSDRLLRENGHDQRITRLANMIRETAIRASSITRSLMTLSRQRNDSRLPIIIDDLIRDNLAFFRTVAGSRVQFEASLGAEGRTVDVSEVGILNSIVNLLINSRDAIADGGTVTLTTGVRRVALEPDSPAAPASPRDYLAIEVADTGSGMAEDVQSRAFEPLFSTKSHGNGIGLASVLEFAREMGGDACLDSAPGSGARVYIYLPVMTADPAAPGDLPAGAPADAATTGRQSIVVVEDEPYALEALTEMLELEGYAVTPCKDALEALQAIGQGSPGLLLSDIVMPGTSGATLAEDACSRLPGLKVILMSGYIPEAENMRPDWMFIRKPMDNKVLLYMIRQALSGGDSDS